VVCHHSNTMPAEHHAARGSICCYAGGVMLVLSAPACGWPAALIQELSPFVQQTHAILNALCTLHANTLFYVKTSACAMSTAHVQSKTRMLFSCCSRQSAAAKHMPSCAMAPGPCKVPSTAARMLHLPAVHAPPSSAGPDTPKPPPKLASCSIQTQRHSTTCKEEPKSCQPALAGWHSAHWLHPCCWPAAACVCSRATTAGCYHSRPYPSQA
jgi:hypothetical protein